MIAYNQKGLDSLFIRDQAQDAFASGCITNDENTKIKAAYPAGFYTPNVFICIGLFVLTVIITSCSLGLFILMNSGSTGSINVLTIFFSLLCYAALELTVYKFRHFRSGVDYALLWMSAGLLFAGIDMTVNNMSTGSLCIMTCLISLFFALRFANNVMSLISYAALLTYIFLIVTGLSKQYQLLLPFLIMAVSIALFIISARLYHLNICRHYRDCLTTIKIATLVSFYLAGNYFAISELNSYIAGDSGNSGAISFGWLFWTLTVITPLFYLYTGVRKKDHLFLWTGLGLIAATIFTIRYYYHLIPLEWELLCGGAIIMAIAYGLIRFLKVPRHGFTSKESNDKHLLEKLNIESLVIAETFSGVTTANAPSGDFQFGGGSGGGGGAGGEY